MSIRVGIMSDGSLVETIKKTLGKPSPAWPPVWVSSPSPCASPWATRWAPAWASPSSSAGPRCGGPWPAASWSPRSCSPGRPTASSRRSSWASSPSWRPFIATAIITQPDWLAAGKGAVVPEVPGGVGLLLVALVGTNFSLNAAFYAGYASRERGLRRDQYRETTLADTIPGIVAPGVMTALVIAAAAAVLGGKGGPEGATLNSSPLSSSPWPARPAEPSSRWGSSAPRSRP